MMRAPATDLPIVLDNASVAARGMTILDRVSLTLQAGQPTVVIGPNGAGKTTLLRLAMGLVRPCSGRITWGGRGDAASERARRRVFRIPLPIVGGGSVSAAHRRAIVFQRPVMLRRSAAANLSYALAAAGVPRAARAARVDELLALVGLSKFGDRRPARKLSGGEQQKLALARALAKDPQILFLDEPTASLDPAATKSVEDLIRAIAARGIKVVMATHDLGAAKRLAGEIVLMHLGRVVETGEAAAFFAEPKTEEARRFAAGELLV